MGDRNITKGNLEIYMLYRNIALYHYGTYENGNIYRRAE